MKKYLLLPLVLVAGCSSFDRTTFNTLTVSKSVLTTAQADYESGTLPHTACVQTIINDGKTSQTLAEVAFGAYFQVEQAKGDVTATQAAVVTDLLELTPIIVNIKGLYTNPNCTAATTATGGGF